MPRYIVLGNVGIALDRDEPYEIGEVYVGRKPPRKILGQPRPDLSSTFPGHLMRVPPYIEFKTETYFWSYVVTDSHQAAMRHVKDRRLPPLGLALSRDYGWQVDLEVLCAYDRDSGQGKSEGGSAVSVRPLMLAPLKDAERVAHDSLAVDGEDKAREATGYLSRARAIANAVAYLGSPAADAAVVEYMKALEAMAGDSRLSKPTENLREKQSAEIATLRRKLDGARTPKQEAAAVMAVADDLRRLDRKFLDQRIENMAEELGLSADWLKLTRRLLKARNKLAHPGGVISKEERHVLLHGTTEGSPDWARSADWAVTEAVIQFARFFE